MTTLFPEALGRAGAPSVLGEILRGLNAALLAVGAAYITMNIVVGTMNTAQDGEVLGKRWSSMWAPIRTVLGMCMMVPLANGFAASQIAVLTVVKWSIGLADSIWLVAVSALVLNGASLAQIVPPKTDDFIGGLLANLVCEQTLNNAYGGEPGQPNQSNFVVREITGWDGTKVTKTLVSGGWPGGDQTASVLFVFNRGTSQAGKPVCGGVQIPRFNLPTTPAPTTGPSGRILGQASAVYRANLGTQLADRNPGQYAHVQIEEAGFTSAWIAAISAAEADLTDLARQIADQAAFPAAAQGEIDLEAAAATIQRARDQLANAIYQEAQRRYMGSVSSAQTDLAAMMKAGGWPSAASFHRELASVQERIWTMANSVSESVQPTAEGLTTTMANSLRAGLSTVDTVARHANLQTLNAMVRSGRLLPGAAGQPRESDDGISRIVPTSVDRAIDKELIDLVMASEADAWVNPMGTLSGLGNRILSVATGGAVVGAVAMLSPGANGISAVASRGMAAKAFEGLSGPIMLAMLALIAGAVMLAFILPVQPYIVFTIQIFAWIILVCEAVVAAPIWAFAHLKLEGEGVAGEATHAGYRLMLTIFLRPVLMVIGMVVGMMIFMLASGLISTTYFGAARIALGGNNAGLIGAGAHMLIGATLSVVAAQHCYSLVHTLPDRILRWVGGYGDNDGSSSHGDKVVGGAIAATQKAEQYATGAIGRRGQGRKGGGSAPTPPSGDGR
ncbi:DotA/TraY family protein [Dankookia rubra]|nr:DotA/TraY family protein [Dankookia rubra]